MADMGIFDNIVLYFLHETASTENRQDTGFAAAKQYGVGIRMIKVIRPRETVKELDPRELIRFALSLNGPDGIVLGIDSMEVIRSNVEILKNFTPLDASRMKELAYRLQPFYFSRDLPWMQQGYHDGHWA